MSKKKASSSGSTMTLKDFHGGSIPSDLPLPSAPGVSSDHPGFDHKIPTKWGKSSRPGSSSGSAYRGFDDKASILSHPVHIGRNFDEDERKPLNDVPIRRRTISDETIPSRPELKLDSQMPAKFSGRQILSPVSHSPGTATSSLGNAHQTVPNAWGMRKEVGLNEPVSSSRFEQVSALQKVSLGRWQSSSKHAVLQPNVEILQLSAIDSDLHSKDQTTHNGVNPMDQKSDLDEMSTRHGERGWSNVEDGSGGRQLPNYERPRSLKKPEARESNSSLHPHLVRPASADDKYGVSQLQPSGPSELLERPKLKLLPRSKPLETVEPSTTDYKLGYQQPDDSGHVVAANELYGNVAQARPSSTSINGSSRAEERPKVNLKPRTHLPEQSGNVESERNSLFGGARPRELVLKERGVDDDAISNLDTIESPNRVKQDLPQTYKRPEIVVQTARSAERLDNFPVDQRTGRDPERKPPREDTGKADTHSSSWRKDSWRNVKGVEKQQQQEQRPEPETWRKPVEQPKPSPTDVPCLRYGKAASPLELAQAFSRPISSSTKTSDHHSSHKGLAERNQVPFSRLTATATELRSSSSPRHMVTEL